MAVSNYIYQPGKETKLIELKDMPELDTGAPMPYVLADEQQIQLFYYVQGEPRDWNVTPKSDAEWGQLQEKIAIITFKHALVHCFGPPNDEAISGHPLSAFGLESYSVFEVVPSAWLSAYEVLNRVHHRHSAERFKPYRHFVFTFHDSIFECIAKEIGSEIQSDSMAKIVGQQVKKFFPTDSE